MTDYFGCPHCASPVEAGSFYCGACGKDLPGGVATAAFDEERLAKTAEAAVLDNLIDATLGDFEIRGELGRGGMAVVYLAHEIALDRKVAIKVLSAAVLAQPGIGARFMREARVSGALNHPHIVRIHQVKQTEDLLYFVMGLVSGCPLDSIIEAEGTLPADMVRVVIHQVGAALGYAHRQGVIHRDIKPGNIMLDQEGFALVTDFGIAKAQGAVSLTQSGLAIGTPRYMSPEQFYANAELTGASDQYSLGVVAYEMLAGRRPYDGDDPNQIISKILMEDPEPLQVLRPDCPGDLAETVHRMLSKQPAGRFATMEDCISAVGAVTLPVAHPVRQQMIAWAKEGADQQRRANVSTPRSSSAARKRKKSKKKRMVLAVLATLVVALAGWAGMAMRTGSPTPGDVRVLSSITGEVWSGTEPLPGATVSAGIVSVVTDREGRFGIPNLDSGSYMLRVTADGHQPREASLRLTGDSTIPRIDLTPILVAAESHDVSGRVTDPNGGPVDGARVSLATGEATVSGIDGTFRLTGVASGQHRIQVSKNGLEPASLTVTVPSAEMTAVHLAFERKTVVGVVIDSVTRRGVRGASVRIGSLSTETDTLGAFRLTGAERRSADLGVSHEWYRNQTVTLGAVTIVADTIRLVPVGEGVLIVCMGAETGHVTIDDHEPQETGQGCLNRFTLTSGHHRLVVEGRVTLTALDTIIAVSPNAEVRVSLQP